MIYNVYCLLLLFFVANADSALHLGPFRKDVDSEGKTCPSTDRVINLPADSKIRCAALCESNDNCDSAFFDETKNMCGGSKRDEDYSDHSLVDGGVQTTCFVKIKRQKIYNNTCLRSLTKILHAYSNPFNYRIDIELMSGEKLNAVYEAFNVTGDKYRLYLAGNYSGSLSVFPGTGLTTNQNSQIFSTADSDNDVKDGVADKNCAVLYGGGFWYKNCGDVVPNTDSMIWGILGPVKSKMMIREI